MRLVTYSTGGAPRAGIVIDGKVVDLSAAGYADVLSFLQDGDRAIAAAASLKAGSGDPALESVKLHAPVPKSDKFICIGVVELAWCYSLIRSIYAQVKCFA